MANTEGGGNKDDQFNPLNPSESISHDSLNFLIGGLSLFLIAIIVDIPEEPKIIVFIVSALLTGFGLISLVFISRPNSIFGLPRYIYTWLKAGGMSHWYKQFRSINASTEEFFLKSQETGRRELEELLIISNLVGTLLLLPVLGVLILLYLSLFEGLGLAEILGGISSFIFDIGLIRFSILLVLSLIAWTSLLNMARLNSIQIRSDRVNFIVSLIGGKSKMETYKALGYAKVATAPIPLPVIKSFYNMYLTTKGLSILHEVSLLKGFLMGYILHIVGITGLIVLYII